jgi:DNA-binding CsgD family transcriptional regulator
MSLLNDAQTHELDRTERLRVGKLLRAVVDIADGCADLAGRRVAVLSYLAEEMNAISGHWGWGRGRPEHEAVLPMGFIPFGYTQEQLAEMQLFMTDPRLQEDFHKRLTAHRLRNIREDGVWSAIAQEELADVLDSPQHWIYQSMRRIGVGDWLQAGRYDNGCSCSVIVLGRAPGLARFNASDRWLMEILFSNVTWLWAMPDEHVPQDSVEALTPRQRTVTYLLLEGMSRKMIAVRLGISQQTVGDHIKAIFEHFKVHSAMELASLFLRRL